MIALFVYYHVVSSIGLSLIAPAFEGFHASDELWGEHEETQ